MEWPSALIADHDSSKETRIARPNENGEVRAQLHVKQV
jgi:hypothetical protein